MSDTSYEAKPLFNQYQARKVVEAFKIKAVEDISLKGSRKVRLFSETGCSLDVGESFLEHHTPKPGGYLVNYGAGEYKYSPALLFEANCNPVGDFRSRLETEGDELTEKLEKLIDFMSSSSFGELSERQRTLLSRQQMLMALYLETLTERLADLNSQED